MAIFVPRFVRQLRDVLLTAPADGEVLTYDSADEKWKNEAGGGGGGAPTTADYLVGTAQAGLSAEIVAGTSPGGELGGTWSAPTVDATHSGSSHAATQAAAEAASVILAPASSARNVIQPTALATGLTLVPFDNNESFTDTPSLAVSFAGNPAASALAFKLFTDPVVNNFDDAAANLIEGYFQLATTINGLGGAQASAILHGAGALTLSGTPVGVPALRVRDSGFTTLFEIARTGWVMSREQADPAAPPANYGLIYVRDNGSGLTQWCVRFPTGAVYVLATEGDGAIYRVGGTDVALADGGTGSSTAAGARTNLGVVIGTDVPAQATFDDHSARHESAGADAIKLDDLAAPDDNTDLNASTTKHGLTPKLSNVASEYLSGTGVFSTPSGSGIPGTIFDANTILKADTDDTPVALTMGASTIVARLAAGNIKAASVAEINTLLGSSIEQPWMVQIDPWLGYTVVQGTWVRQFDVATYLNSYLYNSTVAINDEITYPIVVSAGTWTLEMIYVKGTNAGIATFSLDGSSIGTIDTYGSGANQYSAITGISIAASGKKTLSIKMATKNASSSAYRVNFSAFCLVRTA